MTGDNESIDKGLAEAFGRRALEHETAIPAASVLRILQAKNPSVRAVHLDSPSVDDAPVKVTAEARQLRDPSGRYQLLGEIGRGGIGTVYKGRDQDLGRDVAMKVLKDEFAERPDVLARFVEEAQIGGQLQHPGIVPVYELGLSAGERPYFAMKLVKGETLAAHLARRDQLTDNRRKWLGVFEQVCQTMAYAHARQVVHRDLKPANIMIGAFGEVQVVDWGFAKVLPKGGIADEKESVQAATERSVIETVRSSAEPGSGSASVAGSMLGTPAYMPPEQALGDVERVDQRSDVFALGAILCEILSGEPPYRDADGDLVRQAANAQLDGAHERLGRCGADEALVQLCAECLSPAKRARPESAQKLADRIGDYLHSVEERARQAEVRAAEVRFKHRITLVTAAAALLLTALGAGSWIYLQHEEQQRRAEVTQQVNRAMNLTSRALGNALAATDTIDVTKWESADQSAASLRSLLESDDIEPDVREQAKALLAQVEDESSEAREIAAQQQRDRDMVERLENLRIPIDDDIALPDWRLREARRLDDAYGDAFTTYLGRSPFQGSVDAVLSDLQAGEIALQLATSLDHWGLVRHALSATDSPPDRDGTARVRELATRLDGEDEWRSELRPLLADPRGARDQLEALVQHADFAALGASGCRVLSDALILAGANAAARETLRRARELHPDDFDLCFRLAVSFEFLGRPRWEDAHKTLRIAHALRPRATEVLHRQGMALEKLGRYADAERTFRKLIAMTGENPHWLRHLGGVVALQGRLEEGFECYRKAIAIAPGDAATHSNLYRVRGELERALEHQERALAVDADDPRYLTNHGVVLRQLDRVDEAEQSYRKALASAPRHKESRSNLVVLLLEQGRGEEALALLDRLLEQDSEFSDLHAHRGEILSDLGREPEAIEAYRRALQIDDRHPWAHNDLGRLLIGAGRIDDAVTHFRAAIETDPTGAVAWFNLGVGLERQGEFEEAIRCLERVIELDENHASAWQTLVRLVHRTGQTDAAVARASAMVDRFPDLAKARFAYGFLLSATGRNEEAVTQFHEAVRIGDDLVAAHSHLCTVLARLERFDEAIEHGRRAVDFAQDDADALATLGSALLLSERPEDALPYIERALELDPDGGATHQNLAAALMRIQPFDLERASHHAERAVALGAGGSRLELLLGRVRARQGRFEEALSHYDEAVRLEPGLERSVEATMEQLERTLAELSLLLEILRGSQRATDADQWHRAVDVAYRRGMHTEIVQLTERSLAEDPTLVDGRAGGPYDSACSAVLLAGGDANDVERARLHALARNWLSRSANTAPKSLMKWALEDPDFASVRGEALEALPVDEREAWKTLWQQIQEAMK